MRNLATAVLLIISAAIVLGGLAAAGSASGASAQIPKLRIGTYDNRAIAIAFASSNYNPVGEKMKEYEAAKAAGDTKRAEALEAWGEKRQRQLHRQGFGRVPVDDLLAHVRDRLPEVARKAKVDAIAWHCDFAAENVEEIDITMELVALFDPSPQALKWAKDVKNHDPVDLDELARHEDH